MKTKWYLHNSHCTDEIIEQLEDWGVDLSKSALQTLAEQIKSNFYEIGFEVGYDKTGKITSLKLMPK